jgi:Reverse transcriptase (RNA-dependent DNA polymerase)
MSILELEFIHCSINKCVYIHYSSKDKCILGLYIDNFNIARHLTAIKHFKAEFTIKFDIKDLGLMKFLLGIQVSQQEKKVAIFQATYMRSIITTFTLKDDLFNSVLISKRDCDNIIKAVRDVELDVFSTDKHLY